MTNSTNSPNWCQLVELAANWLAGRHAVCHRTNGPMAISHQFFAGQPTGGQLVELAGTGRKLALYGQNWIDAAYAVCHWTNDPMTNWWPISLVGGPLANWLELDGAPRSSLAGKSPVGRGNIHESFRGRRRGPWRFSELGGFIGDADLSLLTERKNMTPQQQQGVAHDHL